MWQQFSDPCLDLQKQTSHYSDIIMGTMVSQITSLTSVYSTVYSGTDQRKYQSIASLVFCAGDSPGTGEFPAQKDSNAETVSNLWRHHGVHEQQGSTRRYRAGSCLECVNKIQRQCDVSGEYYQGPSVPKGPINNIPALVRPGDKQLFEPMLVRLPTYICVTLPQRVNVHNSV